MPSNKNFKSLKKSISNKLECTICHKQWDSKGFGNHQQACEKKHLLALQQREYEKQMEASNPTHKFYFVSITAEYFKI